VLRSGVTALKESDAFPLRPPSAFFVLFFVGNTFYVGQAEVANFQIAYSYLCRLFFLISDSPTGDVYVLASRPSHYISRSSF